MAIPEKQPSAESLLYDANKVKRRSAFLINFLYFGLIAALVLLGVRYLFKWMIPFVLAFLVAAVLQRPLKWLVRKTNVSKKFFSVVLLVLIILTLAGFVAFTGWQLVVWLTNFVTNPDNIDRLQSTILSTTTSLQQLLTRLSNTLSPQSLETLNTAISNLSQTFISFATDLFTHAATWAVTFTTTRLPLLLVAFIIWVIASIFLSIDYDRVVGFLLRQLPERHRELIDTTRELCSNTIFKLLRAYLLLMLITFAELSIGLSILKIPYAIPLAALIAVVDILPVLGTGTILIPWALISLLTGNIRLFIGIGLLYIIITILRNILEPRIVSHQIGLNPLVTLFFMYLGLQTIGILGMLLFPVIIMVLKQLQDTGRIRIWK